MIEWYLYQIDSPIQAMVSKELQELLASMAHDEDRIVVASEVPAEMPHRRVRFDFCLFYFDPEWTAGPFAAVAVECDGIMWHDEDKDRARDREVQKYLGVYTVRLPGHAIWEDAQKCTARVLKEFAEAVRFAVKHGNDVHAIAKFWAYAAPRIGAPL